MDLDKTQKAAITVTHHDGDGNATDLGDQYHFVFSAPGVAEISAGFLSALAPGVTTLTVTTMANTLPTDVLVSVTEVGDPEPGDEHLTVTFGTPVPK